MLFELHVTVNETDVGRWVEFCGTQKAKPLHIELSSGTHRRQLMYAATTDGNLELALAWAAACESKVEEAGFEVARAKLECPLDKSFGLVVPEACAYSECHMKLMLPEGDHFDGLPITSEVLENWIVGGSIHASRNLLAVKDGWQKFYLTLRNYVELDPRRAARQFAEVYGHASRSVAPLRMEMERVLFDSFPQLDEGWAWKK